MYVHACNPDTSLQAHTSYVEYKAATLVVSLCPIRLSRCCTRPRARFSSTVQWRASPGQLFPLLILCCNPLTLVAVSLPSPACLSFVLSFLCFNQENAARRAPAHFNFLLGRAYQLRFPFPSYQMAQSSLPHSVSLSLPVALSPPAPSSQLPYSYCPYSLFASFFFSSPFPPTPLLLFSSSI